MKTLTEIEKLKRAWKSDPCWDIEDTAGFQEYAEELKQYRLQCETEWEKQRNEREAAIDAEARQLGIEGLYRKIRRLELLEERHAIAIEYLSDGEAMAAYRTLKGYDI